MDVFAKLIADGKKLWADGVALFNGINPPALRATVGVVLAILAILLFVSILPWIGFVVTVAMVALIGVAVWRAIGSPKP